MHLRPASAADSAAIQALYLAAFAEEERQLVADLAVGLLTEKSQPACQALVAEKAGVVLGHIAFSPVQLPAEPGWLGFLLAPLAVQPAQQRQGVGSQLIGRGKELLAALGGQMLFVYGDPGYYGRFGFTAEAAARLLPPHPLAYPVGWQALSLQQGPLAPLAGQITCVNSLNDSKLW